jgi:hypothetical protein
MGHRGTFDQSFSLRERAAAPATRPLGGRSMSKRVVIAVLAVVVATVLGFVALLAGTLWMVGQDHAKFIENARKSDPRIANMYELYPEAEARFTNGNRAGRRGAFAPIVQTFTLRANVGGKYVLSLYRGIGPDGTTIVEGAYGLQLPTGRTADLTEVEFDALLGAKGDLSGLNPEIWNRPPLPSKHL